MHLILLYKSSILQTKYTNHPISGSNHKIIKTSVNLVIIYAFPDIDPNLVSDIKRGDIFLNNKHLQSVVVRWTYHLESSIIIFFLDFRSR